MLYDAPNPENIKFRIMKNCSKVLFFILGWVIFTASVLYFYKLNNERLIGVYESNSSENSERLNFFLDDYHSEHGNYPPRLYQRKPTEPYHSWRVLLLAHMPGEGPEIYKKYDFSQEWNSKHNLQIIGNYIPREYYVESPSSKTFYLSYDLEDDWPFNGWMKSRICKNGNDKFIIIEHPDSGVHWAEPKF